jgi:hypothetical protein
MNQTPRHKTAKPREAPSAALASSELQENLRKGRKRRGEPQIGAGREDEEDEETRPGAVAVGDAFTGRSDAPVLSEATFAASVRSEPSLVVAELEEASQEEEELRRRNIELEKIVRQAVTETVVVGNSGGGDHDQSATASSAFGRKRTRFAFALLNE